MQIDINVALQETNLHNAKENLKTNAKELDVMKDFATTTEVWLLD